MTAEVSRIPLSIDYTSRDYYSIREDLVNLVKQRVNQSSSRKWSGDDPSDFGVALIEAFAYVGDLTNYYIDRIANETYLPTATQRKSIINLASLYGYSPTGFRAATIQVTFSNTYQVAVTGVSGSGTVITYTAPGHIIEAGDRVTITGVNPVGYNLTNQIVTSVTSTTFTIDGSVTASYVSGGIVGKSFVIPQGTQVSGNVIIDELVEEVIFTTLEEVTVPPNGNILAWAEHGESVALRAENLAINSSDISGELLGTSDGLPNQIFALSENEVVEDTIEVYVQSGDVYELWTKVNQLTDFGPFDAVYTTQLDENNFVYIVFGDGVSGFIPNTNSAIKTVYRVGGGVIGNINSEIINTIDKIPGFTQEDVSLLSSYVSVSNPLDEFNLTGIGTGGSEPEDNRSIRLNASRALRSSNRAVSLQDYSDLALSVENLGKAKAVSDIWTSVTLYVAPIRNLNDLDVYPGKTSNGSEVTSEWVALQTATQEFFEDKTLLGSTLIVAPPIYVPVTVKVSFVKNDQFTAQQTKDDINQTIINQFSYPYLEFGQVITPAQISGTINNLRSVNSATVTSLYKTGTTEVLAALVGGPSEIFVFTEDNVLITELSNNADLSTLISTPSGTFSPTFSATQYSYNLLIPNGTASITLTPTVPTTPAGKIIRVNGVVVGSGTASGSITTAVGITEVLITVTAPDGFTSKVYTINVSRAS
jgi:hypothetical protein